MSYNIRLDIASDGDNRWDRRRHFFIEQIEWMQPEIIGLQEVVDGQLRDLRQAMPRYQFVGVARDDGRTKGEYSPIGINRDRMTLKSSGTFWLSPTPDRPSKGWDAAFIRIATWAHVVDRRDGQKMLLVNTHLDNEGVTARREGAAQIRRWIDIHRTPGERVIVTGDFNSGPDDAPLAELLKASAKVTLRDSRAASVTAPVGPEGTFNGFKANPEAGKRIDYVLVDGAVRVERSAVLKWDQDGRVASDHFPVIAETRDAQCRRTAG